LIFFHLQFISLLKGKSSKSSKVQKVQKVQLQFLEYFFSEEKNPKSSKKVPGIFFLGKKTKGQVG